MDTIMKNRAANPLIIAGYPGMSLRTSFAFSSDTEVRAVYDVLLPTVYEKAIFDKFSSLNLQNSADYLGSRERMVLVDMAWNGGPGLIGKSLTNAIISGNRAAAWFEIRYGSNKGKDRGLAKRRYLESQLFGLYADTNHVAQQEALQVYQMLTDHRQTIVKYESQFGIGPDAG